jgi:hypothetical protein
VIFDDLDGSWIFHFEDEKEVAAGIKISTRHEMSTLLIFP